MRHRHLAGVLAGGALALSALAVSGCGATGPSAGGSVGPEPSGAHTMADGQVMSESQMTAMAPPASSLPKGAARAGGPSASARLICGTEIAAAVKENFGLESRPTGAPHWSGATRTYTCRYPLATSVLTLSVKDLDDRARGRAYFEHLRHAVAATPIKGLEALGFPAFENRRGQVGFLKDGKTLYVDGSRVARSNIPHGLSRTIVAYGVAAAVIGCWTE